MTSLREAGFALDHVSRGPTGNVSGISLKSAVSAFLGVHADERRAWDVAIGNALEARGLPRLHHFNFTQAATYRPNGYLVAGVVGYEPEELWPARYGLRAVGAAPTIADAIRSAEAFGLAIDALPVGRDIRTRLQRRLGDHIATLKIAARR